MPGHESCYTNFRIGMDKPIIDTIRISQFAVFLPFTLKGFSGIIIMKQK